MAIPGGAGLLEMTDTQGQIIQRTAIFETARAEVQVLRGKLPAGLYILRFLEANGKQYVQKLVFK